MLLLMLGGALQAAGVAQRPRKGYRGEEGIHRSSDILGSKPQAIRTQGGLFAGAFA